MLKIIPVSPDFYGNHFPMEIIIRGIGFNPDSEVMLHQGNPEKVKSQDTPAEAYGLDISGFYAYVADFERGKRKYPDRSRMPI